MNPEKYTLVQKEEVIDSILKDKEWDPFDYGPDDAVMAVNVVPTVEMTSENDGTLVITLPSSTIPSRILLVPNGASTGKLYYPDYRIEALRHPSKKS